MFLQAQEFRYLFPKGIVWQPWLVSNVDVLVPHATCYLSFVTDLDNFSSSGYSLIIGLVECDEWSLKYFRFNLLFFLDDGKRVCEAQSKPQVLCHSEISGVCNHPGK